jgi:hypothetical protein
VRSLFLCVLFWSLPSFAQVMDPILAIPITDEFLNDAVIRGYFADVLRQGGFGHWKTERAAFLVRDEGGQYRCVGWPMDGRLQRQEFRGAIPERTVAIIHTHPSELPLGSTGDERTAVKQSVPIFVLTPLNIYMITAGGVSVAVVENRQWATFSASSSIRCSTPDSRASRRRTD